MLDRFTSMEVFRALVRRGTFNAAAEELGISKAMASKHIQALEERLGVRLFNRTTRVTRLTEAGQRYFEGIEAVFTDLELAEARVLDDAAGVRGTLSVTAPPVFGVAYLAPLVGEFMLLQPQVRVRLTLTDRHVDLVEEGIDVAITVRDLEDTNYIARHLADVAMRVCAAPSYLERHGTPRRPEDLSAHNCLIFADERVDMRSTWQFTRRQRSLEVKVAGRFTANDGAALHKLAIAGHGFARLPAYLVEDDIVAERLTVVLDNFAPPLRPVYALYPHREHLPGKLRSFIDFAVKSFALPLAQHSARRRQACSTVK